MASQDTEARIINKLNDIFRFVFDDESIEVSRKTSSADIEAWDSLTHITLISEVEDTFGMKFFMKEVVGMKNVGEMIDIIAQRADPRKL
ncbi:MAG: acyl carrier protein [Clostridia bacterium]|nr:acyl carrier protein [Clostridia bacterium]